MKTEKTVSAGFPLTSVLTTIFVLAKLFGKISWSWWWVFSPLWIGVLVVIGLILLIAFIAVIAACID